MGNIKRCDLKGFSIDIGIANLRTEVRLLDCTIHLSSISRLSSPTISGNRCYFDLEMLQRY